MTSPFLIAGLGNPGADYARTRHNAGFLAVEELARTWQTTWTEEARFEALVARTSAAGRPGWLLRPLTYMNLSGRSVAATARYFRIELPQILVIVDDADLRLGTVRLRADGSSGGHHGLESIEAHLGTRAYARLRLGIGRRDTATREITGHVLGRFTAEEWEIFSRVLRHAAAQVACWLEHGIDQAMTRFNGAVP